LYSSRNPTSRGTKSRRRFQQSQPAAPKLPDPLPGAKSPARRTVLANWIASRTIALTARVIVNPPVAAHLAAASSAAERFRHGKALPTHPELLDCWRRNSSPRLAMKGVHRLILTFERPTKVSSRGHAEAFQTRSHERSVWRFDMRRLTGAESAIRSWPSAGNLNLKMYA